MIRNAPAQAPTAMTPLSLMDYITAISFYFAFGFIHEFSHFCTALLCGLVNPDQCKIENLKDLIFDMLIYRRFSLEFSGLGMDGDGEGEASSDPNLVNSSLLIRHVGWVTSIVIAIALHVKLQMSKPSSSDCIGVNVNTAPFKRTTTSPTSFWTTWYILAAYLTAFDAISTDLLGFPQMTIAGLGGLLGSMIGTGSGIEIDDTSSQGPSSSHLLFYCGNFGIILLHGAWLDAHVSGGKGGAALDILEKMIQVTMMRGAQSGGVVTFQNKSKSAVTSSTTHHEMAGVRTRVVKSKRGDLSKLLRAKIEKEIMSSSLMKACRLPWGRGDEVGGRQHNLESSVRSFASSTTSRQGGGGGSSGSNPHDIRFFAGHTRFATSSKATLDGTHPHQWTAHDYRVYDMETLHADYMSGTSMVNDLSQNLGNTVNDLSSSILRRRRADVNLQHHVRRTRSIAVPKRTRVENYITHNGDFEFYTINEKMYDVGTIQKWLEYATETKMKTVVDSAAIAGMIDLIRAKGCFTLGVRYAICLGLPTSGIDEDIADTKFPSQRNYEAIGDLFEQALCEFQTENPLSLDYIGSQATHRESLVRKATENLIAPQNQRLLGPFSPFIRSEENGASPYSFAKTVVDAFFDNDLFFSVKLFMENASGSFGLCATSSLDSHRQLCLASRGQTISVAFYPQKRIVLFGSEQAAVKAGMNVDFPGRTDGDIMDKSHLDVDNDVLRLDLDDLGGEICLLDWGATRYRTPALSLPNRNIPAHATMHDRVDIYLLQESQSFNHTQFLYHRMTKLTRNPLITELREDSSDPIQQDIWDIPMICKAIQDDWRNEKKSPIFSLNRLTVWNLGRCLKNRLEGYASGSLHPSSNRVDVLLTGCEVSLWLAEQFASDLQKAFPKLHIVAVSSNKLLGLFGQEDINVPAIGFPTGENNLKFDDAITIIVSHSGGTFSPLGLSSLFQSTTKNIFVVTSEWDTQIGKQLRTLDNDEGISFKLLFNSRIFSTGVGVRSAEPCSVSVVATHQLLTNIFEFISIVILSDDRYRKISGAVITERDLEILETCNKENISALEEIVGAERNGTPFTMDMDSAEKRLRAAGDIWSEHILENAKAYIVSFVYVFGTVVSGYPLISGIAAGVGLPDSSAFYYLLRFLDALIYFFLPQINVLILRVVQKRPLRHRMVGRTVVVGDIPWVAQAAEAFLSKIFACSYSIAGINVHSANPSDHLVHRMTHRVMRGTLLICGRPDGRLSALTAMENAVCLSINQASSIQSIGSTCESITIGHNKFKLPLTARAIFLERHRPLFLCEQLLKQRDAQPDVINTSRHRRRGIILALEDSSHRAGGEALMDASANTFLDETLQRSGMARPTLVRRPSGQHSSTALLGMYKTLERDTIKKIEGEHLMDSSTGGIHLHTVLETTINEKKWSNDAWRLFEKLDLDNDARLSINEFVEGMVNLNSGRSKKDITNLFRKFDKDNVGSISFDQFHRLMTMNSLQIDAILKPTIRDPQGLIQVRPSKERFFGENLIEKNASGGRLRNTTTAFGIGATKSQNFAQELYESRIASLQRFVSMTVMFHQMGDRVEGFFSRNTFGLLGYRKDRTHSIMRIATTASPISGADVRDRKMAVHFMKKIHHSVQVIENTWLAYKATRLESVDEKKSA